ncbi:ATP-binding cassette domain-containing protein [Streptomyces sp. NPDC097619]|uniref:ATP-binding cassette domain-containing protein n=1 Tax=Streptomyces sp. NPDC097619 TaxID=3157228 RepID=UPI0033297EFA
MAAPAHRAPDPPAPDRPRPGPGGTPPEPPPRTPDRTAASTAPAATTGGGDPAARASRRRGRSGARPRHPVRALVRDALRRNPRAAVGLTVWTLVSAAPALVTGKALALAVDRGFLADRPGTAALGLGAFALAALTGAWAGRRTYPWLAEIIEPARDALLRDVVTGTLRRAVAEPARPEPGSPAVAVAQLTRQTEAVRDALAGQLLLVWQFALTLAAVVAGTAAVAPAAVPLFAAPLLLALLLFGLLAPATVRRQRAAFRTEEELAARTAAVLAALRDLTACGAREEAERELLAAVHAHFRAARSLARVAALRRLIVALGAHLPVLLIVAAAPALVRDGLTPGAVVGVLAYVLTTLEPALRLLVQGVGASWLRLAVAAERLAAAARPPAPPAVPDGPLRPADGSAALSGVTFAYGPGAEPVLDGLDLDLADGAHLAVVGPSGIGKSTLADLLAGLLPPDAGRIRIGGVPLDRIAPRDRPRARVLVPQDPYVFTGSLRDNLRQLAPDTPDGELMRVAEELGLGPLLERLGGPAGTLVPGTLSGGERALVALARAALSPARLVLLDEATRHLDAAAELRVEEVFRRRPGTLVTVTHRPGPARRADLVLLLDGLSPRTGTHRALLAGVPGYAELSGEPPTGAAHGPGSGPVPHPGRFAIRDPETRDRAVSDRGAGSDR